MSNCLFFALGRWFKYGGYIVIRRSKYGPWLHFIWCKDLKDAEIEHYVPIANRLRVESVQKALFRGYVKYHDEKPTG